MADLNFEWLKSNWLKEIEQAQLDLAEVTDSSVSYERASVLCTSAAMHCQLAHEIRAMMLEEF
jgi:hypothetical protein